MKVKQLLLSIVCASILGTVGTANAKPPETAGECAAERPAKPGKVRIAHCGCNADGTDLVWKHIRVSTRAKGHVKHSRAGKEVGCLNEIEDAEITHRRTTSDCILAGEENNIGDPGLEDCPIDPVPVVGESCAVDVPPEVESA